MYAPASCGGSTSGEEFAPDELVGAGLAGCTLLSMQIGLLAQRREVDLIGASGKELYRHQGFIAKEDILKKWRELGIDLTH
jgi:hypothetical protein